MDYATLISPIIHQAYSRKLTKFAIIFDKFLFTDCVFSFYYARNETDLKSNAFDVSIRLQDLNRDVRLWQGSLQRKMEDWNEIQLMIRRVKHPFRMIFRAKASDDEGYYQALTNLNIYNCAPPKPPSGHCNPGLFECTNKVCLLNQYVCDFDDDCGDGSDELKCNSRLMTSFEEGFGRWGEGERDQWIILNSEEHHDLRDAPTFDHTSGSW